MILGCGQNVSRNRHVVETCAVIGRKRTDQLLKRKQTPIRSFKDLDIMRALHSWALI